MSPARTCKACERSLPLEAFRPQSSRPGLFHHTCRNCENELRRKWRAATRAYRPPKPPLTEKRCTRCEEVKPVGEFNKTRDGKPRARCKPCQQQDHREYVERGGDRVRAMRRSSKYRQRFKMESEQVDDLLARAGNRCQACGINRDQTHNKALVLDHDHMCCPTERTCGQCIRGVLCTKCNVALGALDDSPWRVAALSRYLEVTLGG